MILYNYFPLHIKLGGYDYSEIILVLESTGKLLQNGLGRDVKFAHDTEVSGESRPWMILARDRLIYKLMNGEVEV